MRPNAHQREFLGLINFGSGLGTPTFDTFLVVGTFSTNSLAEYITAGCGGHRVLAQSPPRAMAGFQKPHGLELILLTKSPLLSHRAPPSGMSSFFLSVRQIRATSCLRLPALFFLQLEKKTKLQRLGLNNFLTRDSQLLA